MSTDNDFYMSPSLIQPQLLEDDFVNPGTAGTASSRAKQAKKKKGGGRPDKLIDIALTRTQFTAKLMSQRVFCVKAHQECQQLTEEFLQTNAAIHSKYKELIQNGVKEDNLSISIWVNPFSPKKPQTSKQVFLSKGFEWF
jgi:hypothetical protein